MNSVHSARHTNGPRVLLVDDHDLFRTGLRNLLEDQGVKVVAEASTGKEALRHVREFAPDVVLMDLNMPGMNGVETAACGYLLNDSSIQDLVRGIYAASVGE